MIDFSKMTPELYKKVQNTRVTVERIKREVAMLRFDDDYTEECEEEIKALSEKCKEFDEFLKEYEI